MLDAQLPQRPPDLGRPALVDRLAGLERHEIVAAAIGVEARRQSLGDQGLQKSLKARRRAFLLDQEGRIDRARRVVHRHDQVQHRLAFQPGMPAAVLVQHHPLARLPFPLAPVSTAPLGPSHQARRVKLRLDEGVAPAEVVIAQQVLVEMLHTPAKVAMTIKLQHLFNRFRRHPTVEILPKRRSSNPTSPASS
ncbi:hypothetical protein [Mesorhizobium sp. M0909]|uniref:hypothetical protein n=1 Tax=Mesorhizobium sp. M0909 TaxID=2957024 RepID=UPI003339017A